MQCDASRRYRPEERELARQRARLDTLRADLAQQEGALATLRAELAAFEARYLALVGVRLAELDALHVRLATADDLDIAQWRARAASSAQALEMRQPAPPVPDAPLKQLYREVAFAMHPDLTTDEGDRARRQGVMAEANRAYAAGDAHRLAELLASWEGMPEAVMGDGVGPELIRTIRTLTQVEARLQHIATERAALQVTDLARMLETCRTMEAKGTDLLANMAAQLDVKIARAKKRLAGRPEETAWPTPN